jgi:hypothetical protein
MKLTVAGVASPRHLPQDIPPRPIAHEAVETRFDAG